MYQADNDIELLNKREGPEATVCASSPTQPLFGPSLNASVWQSFAWRGEIINSLLVHKYRNITGTKEIKDDLLIIQEPPGLVQH